MLLLANKLNEELLGSCNAKEHCESFIRKKTTKSVKQSELIPYQQKSFKNPNIADIKSVTTEHSKIFNVEMLHFLNSELQLKYAESVIKKKTC